MKYIHKFNTFDNEYNYRYSNDYLEPNLSSGGAN